MKIVRDILAFWKDTWYTDKKLFAAETFGVLFSISGAVVFANGAPNPPLWTVFMLYTIGSLCIAWSSYMRESAWMMVLMGFYTMTNFYGMYNLWNN